MPKINEDELIGYIVRKTDFEYEEVRIILDTEIEFLKEKGLAITEVSN